MFSLPIVKHLNILKNRCSSFCSCLVGLTFNTFLLEGSKETLHECIIVTITFSTHADLNAIPLKQSEIALACILASPIRMVHQPSWRASLLQCHHPRFGHQLFVSLLSHGPANHQPREDIDNGGKIEPPFPCLDASNICHPRGIWSISSKIAVEQIRSHGIAMLTIGGFHFSALGLGVDPTLAHQASDPLASTTHTLLFQLGMDTWAAIDFPILVIRIFDSLSQLFIFSFPLAGFPFAPSVIATFRDTQHFTHTLDGKFVLMSSNEGIFQSWGCAKMRTAFFNISLSCLSISFSLFTCLSSSSRAV